jgi:phosphatidylglycerophosphate synthase
MQSLTKPPRPEFLFPLIRHLSTRVSPFLAATSLSANQITFISLLFGLASAVVFSFGDYVWDLWGGVFLFIMYLLDHCDGEVARLKGQNSRFGTMFDTFVDWIAHVAIFIGLGIGSHFALGHDWMNMAGWIAAAGATINYVISLYDDLKEGDASGKSGDEGDAPERPENWREAILFAFRELARADFWLIVLVLCIVDQVWYLLPFVAIGAHVYWITALFTRHKTYRV